jgi:hypothetical protein
VKNVGVSLALGLETSLSENMELSLVLFGGPILSGHFKVGVAIVTGKKGFLKLGASSVESKWNKNWKLKQCVSMKILFLCNFGFESFGTGILD